LPDPWDKMSRTDLPPEQTARYLPEPDLIPLAIAPRQRQPSWDERILLSHVPAVPPDPFPLAVELLGHCGGQHLPRWPLRGQRVQAMALGHSPRLQPPCPGSAPHLSVPRPCREPNPRRPWRGDAGVMPVSLCLITAVLKAWCLSHCPGRLGQGRRQERDLSAARFS